MLRRDAFRRVCESSAAAKVIDMQSSAAGLKIILSAVEPELADAWQRFCGDLPFVILHRGSILELSCDAVVSPANSFGFMDGGIDMLYSRHFGWQVQERLQK